MKINKKTILIVGLLLVVLLVVYITSSGAAKVKSVQLKKVNIENREVNKTVSASGVVKSIQSADLAFPATQTIARIYVEKGQEVKKGDLLGYLDSTAVEQTAKASRDARDYYVRSRDIFLLNEDDNRESLGNKEFELKLRQYNEQVDQYEASYQASLATIGNYYLYAPFDGTILDVLKKEGEMSTAGVPVLRLADTSKIEFEVNVDQEDYGQLKVGQSAEINLDSFDGKIFEGKISTLPLYADGSSTPTFVVKLDFVNLSDNKPLVGMTGDVKVIVDSSDGPVQSLYYDEVFFDEEKKAYVWVIENGHVSKNFVEIGIEGDLYTEIKSRVDKQLVVGLTSDLEIKDGYKAVVVK